MSSFLQKGENQFNVFFKKQVSEWNLVALIKEYILLLSVLKNNIQKKELE